MPAEALETAVADAAEQVLGDQAVIASALQGADLLPAAWPGYLSKIETRRSNLSRVQLLTEMVHSVKVQEGLLQVSLDLNALLHDNDDRPTLPIRLTRTVPLDLQRRGVEMRLVLRTKPTSTAKVDSRLVQAVARGHAWFEDLLAGKVASINELSIREDVSKSYAGDVIKLAFLAPDIVEAIVAGRQPASLNTDRLTKATDLPIDWDQQKAYLGFA